MTRRRKRAVVAAGSTLVALGLVLGYGLVTAGNPTMPRFLLPYKDRISVVRSYHFGYDPTGHYVRSTYQLPVPATELLEAMADEVGDANVRALPSYAWTVGTSERYMIFPRRTMGPWEKPHTQGVGWTTVSVVKPLNSRLDLLIERFFPGFLDRRYGGVPPEEHTAAYDPTANLQTHARKLRTTIPTPTTAAAYKEAGQAR